LRHPGFPIAEVHADGSSVITKHPGTGGAVTVGTVTAQLLYEIAGARYAGPDVTTRFDTIQVDSEGQDRVRISGVRGEPPPPELKVCLNTLGGHRNAMTFVLTGLDIEAKAALVREQMEHLLEKAPPAEVRWTLARTDKADAATEEEASALLHCRSGRCRGGHGAARRGLARWIQRRDRAGRADAAAGGRPGARAS